jgi:putative DNA primase/helicase
VSTRPLGILRECWHEYNRRWFGGELTPIPITPGGPWTRRLGDFSPAQKRIRLDKRTLARFSDPEVRASVAGTLLHEMVHQWIHATTGDGDDSHGHGPKFTAKCNEIGAQLGLAEVVHRKPRGQEARLSKYWPHVVQGDGPLAAVTTTLTEPSPAGDPVGDTWPSPSNPMAVARQIVAGYQDEDEILTLRRWRGTWMMWLGTHWAEAEDLEIRKHLYSQLENAEYEDNLGDVKPWAPNKARIANLIEAMMAITHLPETLDTPSWTSGKHSGEIVACTNGLLDVATRKLAGHTPAYFNTVSVPFAYDPDAARPEKWLKFLNDLWPDDPEAVDALQEFFGYVISGRTDLHKIVLLIGPSRSGKGTIARILTALLGKGNVAGPTLGTIASQFGLQTLLGKPLAVIPDARVSGTSQAAVVEKLLTISGEDSIDIDRKFREPWTGKLPTRLMILSNELPRFGDASGAISSRFVILMTTRSFLGAENSRLTSELLAELPGILQWSLDGLDRLARNGALTEPKSSADARTALQDMVSPIGAFVREQCYRNGEVPVDVLFTAWKSWCEDNNHRAGSAQTFGKDLRAVVPILHVRQPRDEHGKQSQRFYAGISLKSYVHSADSRVSARVSDDPDDLTRADTRENPLQPQVQPELKYCLAIGCESTDTHLYPSGRFCDTHKPGSKT